MNNIEVYQSNNKTVQLLVTGLNPSGYIPTFNVKKKVGDASIFTNIGTIDGSIATFELTPLQTDINPDVYLYDIVLSSSTNNYTAVQSQLTIKSSVKYT